MVALAVQGNDSSGPRAAGNFSLSAVSEEALELVLQFAQAGPAFGNRGQ